MKRDEDDHWRQYTYQKGKCTLVSLHCYPCLYLFLGRIRAHPRWITSYEKTRLITGIGHRTAEKVLDLAFLSHSRDLIGTSAKIMEIVRTRDLEQIKYERTEDVVVAQRFTKIYGVGE